MPLTTQDKKRLKSIGHHLKPIIQLGDKGVSDALLEELERRLEDHELIKVKVGGMDRDARDATINTLCDKARAELVQRIGNIALLYRAAARPNPKLSNLLKAQG